MCKHMKVHIVLLCTHSLGVTAQNLTLLGDPPGMWPEPRPLRPAGSAAPPPLTRGEWPVAALILPRDLISWNSLKESPCCPTAPLPLLLLGCTPVWPASHILQPMTWPCVSSDFCPFRV